MGTLIVFQIGGLDAERIGKEFSGGNGIVNPVNLNKFEAYVRPVVNGESQTPFQMRTLPPIQLKGQKHERVVARSRERFATRRALVEGRLRGWLGNPS